jgi:F-type H+-transporting ATPase subunit epsilon
MAETFHLRIVTPRRLVLDEEVREATGPGTAGEFGVLPNHAAFLTTLEIGPLSYKGAREQRTLAVRGGFAEVKDNVMSVLVDAALFAEEIDAPTAERDLQVAASRLRELPPSHPEYAAADAERQWAEARLAVARRRH